MKNKIIIFIFVISLVFPSIANGEYKISRNYLKLTEVGTNHFESIEIKNTDLTKKSNVDSLVNEVNGRENFDEISIASVPKFKGVAEEIFDDYADSVVLIGNRSVWATGSGFFINHHGLKIITNWHVVENTKNVDIWLKPERNKKKEVEYLLNNVDSYKGKVVKTNKKKDLAMIQIKGISPGIKPVIFGSFNKVKEGQMGFAIGHPKGNGWSFTDGMISSIRPDYNWHYENSKHFASVIQTQNRIYQGNSGGPLFNKKKELIGVNTFTTAKAENLNFAVSVDDLKEFLDEVQQEEEIESTSKYIKKKKKGSTWIKKKKKNKNKKSTSDDISKSYPNAEKGDANKNGKTDVWFVDENNNGRVDTVIMDLNENGIVDSIGFDENENNNFEIIVFDDDEDGNVDRADFDKDDNGTSDIIAYDYNQDGEWDKYEEVG